MEISEQDIDEIKTSIQAVDTKVQGLILTLARQERDHEYIHDHRYLLYGREDRLGLLGRVERLELWRGQLDRVVWAVLMPLLVAIGGGVVWLIRLAGAGG